MIPGLVQLVKDLGLLWLWHRLADAALIRPLAWEHPYAAGVVLKRQKKKKKNKANINLKSHIVLNGVPLRTNLFISKGLQFSLIVNTLSIRSLFQPQRHAQLEWCEEIHD